MLLTKVHIQILGKSFRALPFLILFLFPFTSSAEDVYQKPEEFLNESFNGETPKPNVLWLNNEASSKIKKILGHEYKSFRIRYWAKEKKSAWILEEIGKMKPITTGFIVNDGKIERIKVLVYRESHGWEVKHPFFTNRFKDTQLKENLKLDRKIDSISGATLSVNAIKKMTAMALFLDSLRTE